MELLSTCHTLLHATQRDTHGTRMRRAHAPADAPPNEHCAISRAPFLSHSTPCCIATCNCINIARLRQWCFSQHQFPFLRTVALHLMHMHLSSHPPCGARPNSNVPSFLLSSLLSFAFHMLLSFLCRILLNSAFEVATRLGASSFAASPPKARSAPRASPSATCCAPADRAHHPQLARVQPNVPNVPHRGRHHTGRLKSPAERPRRGACRRWHVSRRCTRHTQPRAAGPPPSHGSNHSHARVPPLKRVRCVFEFTFLHAICT